MLVAASPDHMNIDLPYGLNLRQYQAPAWNALIHDECKRLVMVWPRRNGKDLITLNMLITKACQRVGLYFYIAPFYTQVRSIIWNGSDGSGRRFLDYIPQQLIKKKNEAELKLELINGSIIRFLGSDNIDSIVGNNPIGIAFTEFSLHKPEVWHYLRPVLAENGGWAIFNGTPRGLNHFYQLYEKAKRSDSWFVQHLTRDITGIPTLEAIDEDRQSGMPESLIEQEYYCSWSASSEETLIPLDLIKQAIHAQAPTPSHVRILGVDPAYAAKGDRAVIARRAGNFLYPLEKHRGLDNMALASRIANHINEWQPQYVCIDSGRGEGVISRLEQLGYGRLIVPVHFSGKPQEDLYANKRAEIWCRMRNWFLKANKGQAPKIPNDDELIADLSAPTFEVNDRGFIQLESKKQIKKKGYGSPDCGDAVAVTFAEDEETYSLGSAATMPLGASEAGGGYWSADIETFMAGQLQQTRQYDPLSYSQGWGYDARH